MSNVCEDVGMLPTSSQTFTFINWVGVGYYFLHNAASMLLKMRKIKYTNSYSSAIWY